MINKTKKKSRLEKIGLPPGSLVHTGEIKSDVVTLHIFDYSPTTCVEITLRAGEPIPTKPSDCVRWIDVDGVHDTKVLEELGKQFNLHPLLLEDLASVDQRAKIEEYDNCLFTVMRMMRCRKEEESVIRDEQFSLILVDHTLLTFQEGPGDVFDEVRQRLRGNKGRIRRMQADYLYYRLLDAVVDGYYSILDRVGVALERVESRLDHEHTQSILVELHHLRRELIFLRKAILPLREVLTQLGRMECDWIADEVKIFLRDVQDHFYQITDSLESNRDWVSGLKDLHLNSLSHRLNEIMKVLTLISTIFLPLTLIVGVYGMNFDIMPELHSRWGYPAVWGVMLLVAGVMLYQFKKRKWI